MDGRNLRQELVSIDILRSCEQKASVWSGGTTTQLAIYPAGSEYKERRFEWRISTARVDSEESVFTLLPGIHRTLMILEGRIELAHEGIRSASLEPFMQDEFDGGWTTRSCGRCVDFNLMTAGQAKGKLEAVCPQNLNLFEREVESEAWEAFYCISETINVTVNIQNEVYALKLNKGDFMLISTKKGAHSARLLLHGVGSPAAVRATIYKNI